MFGDGQGTGYAFALNSPTFFVFTAVVVAAFFLLPRRFRWVVVLVASYAFYASWSAIPAVLGLAALTLASHLSAHAMVRYPARRRIALALGLIVVIGTLAMLKYYDFLAMQAYALLVAVGLPVPEAAPATLGWVLPVGYSFVTFSAASYLVDVYREKMEPARLSEFASYLAYFPKILAGPIERATHLLPQWRERRGFDPIAATEGFQLILWGLFKKVVIADRLALLVDPAYASPAFATPMELIVATYFYAFQIYCDFSGYTDIAIGAFKLFNLHLAPNFQRPYFSRSTGEFWASRWHITLATWFRDYLYIPLGGSRVPWWRHYFNLMVVFVVSGIWHAGMVGTAVSWSFAIWGAINGLYVVLSTMLAPLFAKVGERVPALRRAAALPGVGFVQSFLVFHLITFSWIFFRAGSTADALTVIERIGANLDRLPLLVRFYDFANFEFVASVVLILVLLVAEAFHERRDITERLRRWPAPLRWGYYYALGATLLVLGKWGASQFIYMQF